MTSNIPNSNIGFDALKRGLTQLVAEPGIQSPSAKRYSGHKGLAGRSSQCAREGKLAELKNDETVRVEAAFGWVKVATPSDGGDLLGSQAIETRADADHLNTAAK